MNRSQQNLRLSPLTQRVAFTGMLGALALALSAMETLIPPLPMLPPGAKPGLSNLATMYAAYSAGLGSLPAMALAVGRSYRDADRFIVKMGAASFGEAETTADLLRLALCSINGCFRITVKEMNRLWKINAESFPNTLFPPMAACRFHTGKTRRKSLLW